MKTKPAKVSLPKRFLEFNLQARDPETLEEFVEMCGGSDKAAIQCGMSGWLVKAATHVRSGVAKNQDAEDGSKVEGEELVTLAQTLLDEFTYTGVRVAKKKAKTRVSRAALKEKGASAAQLKNLDALLELLGDDVEVVD